MSIKLKPRSDIFVSVSWMVLSISNWLAIALLVLGLLTNDSTIVLISAALALGTVLLLQFSEKKQNFKTRYFRTFTQYPQLGLLAVASVIYALSEFAGYSNLETLVVPALFASGLLAILLNITRPRFLISKPKAKLKPRNFDDKVTEKFDDKVTIVMPCYNEEVYLLDAIESVKAQTHFNWELIIVDDCSTDNSTRIAAAAAKKDSRIRLIRLRKNSGLPAARNAGFAFANSPFVIFLDGDDALLPNALNLRLKLSWKYFGTWGVATRARQVPESTDWRRYRAEVKKAVVSWVTLAKISGDSPFGVHEVMIRSSRVRQLAGFSEDMVTGAEDAQFWLRSLRSGALYVRSSAIDAIYRQKQGSMIGANLARQAQVTIQVMVDSWNSNQRHDLDLPISHLSTGDIILRERIQMRLFRFLGMTYFDSDTQTRTEIESLIQQHLPIVIDEKTMIDCLRSGVKRNLSRTPSLAEVVDITSFNGELYGVVSKWLPENESRLSPRLEHPKSAVLIENAAQFAKLDHAASDTLDNKLPTLILPDSFDAPQGAWDAVVASSRPYIVRSVPHFSLEGAEYDQIFIPSPTSWIGREVADLYADTNTKIRAWNLPWSDDIEIDDDDYAAANTTNFKLDNLACSTEELLLSLSESGSVERVELAALTRNTVNVVSEAGSGGDYDGLIRPDIEKLQALKNKHKGESCIIIGNGPSLNQIDFNLLRGQVTFGVNGIFYADDKLPEPLTYYVVEDTKVFEENTDAILEYGRNCENVLLPTLYKKSVGNTDGVTFFRMNGGFYRPQDPNFCRPRFSTNAEEVLYCGQSVTYINLQLAYWMGFSEVALIGMDFSYSLPEGTRVSGHLYQSQDDDPNHFDPRYFGAGKTWKNPYLNRVAANYVLAREMFEADGRKIYNCSVGGQLEIFERLSLENFIVD